MGGSAKWRSRIVWTEDEKGRKVPLRDSNGNIVKTGVRVYTKQEKEILKKVQRNHNITISRKRFVKNSNVNNTTTINPVNGRQLSEASKLREVNSRAFRDSLHKAKRSQDDDKKWRVDVHSERGYVRDRDKLYVTDGGSAIAVTPDGDIISVCKMDGDKAFASELLARAVVNGGVKLDSYSGNHDFYTKNGFEPVSWVRWDDRYAPNEWNESYDREPIIFYRYVGHPVTETAEQFMARVNPSKRYTRAMNVRDRTINK